jgi:protocatechuate 3,4-dioxygenase beta subunit
MRQGATIAGVVVDTRDAPVEGARLKVLGQSETGSRVTVRRAEPGLRTAMASGEPVDGSGGGGLGVTAGPVPPIGAASGTAPAPEGPGLDPGTALGSGEYRTDDQGRFRMSGIPPGSLQLVARHPDYAPGTSEPRVVRPGGTLEDVRVVVPDGGTIEGRLVDSRGFPVARVPVELRMEHEPVPRIVVSGEDGTFRFAGTRGPVVLTALPNGRPTTRRRIEVPSGETTELELALEQARSTLEGRTVGPRGFPVSGVQLTVRSLRAETPVRRTVQSTEDGTFELPGLPAPPYRVLAKHPDYATTRLARVEGSDRLRVELQPGASIEGKVLDDWSAAPLTDARIELLDEDGSTRETTRTNSQGQFSFQLVPEGNYKINADHEDFLSASAKAVVKRGARGFQDAEVGRIWLKPAGSMAGRVVDAYGRAVPGAELARGSPPSWEGATRSGPDGRFELHSVPPGTVRLTVRHPTAGRTRRADVRVRPKQRTDGLRIRLPGRYREPEAKPGSGVRTGVALTLAKGPDGGVRIARILSGTSAAEADLRAGDRLLRVDGRRVETVRQARDWLRGPQGVQAVLTVQRGGKPRRIFVVRERYSPEP